MLRKFLTEEEKAQLDEQSQRYREWRSTIDSHTVPIIPEERSIDGANDDGVRNASVHRTTGEYARNWRSANLNADDSLDNNGLTVGQNNQKSRLKYLVTRSSIRSNRSLVR